jgi:hypothetical protein
MNVFKTITLKWWQAALFKAGIWALGIAVGAYWHNLFSGVLPELVAIGVVCLSYVSYVWARQ